MSSYFAICTWEPRGTGHVVNQCAYRHETDISSGAVPAGTSENPPQALFGPPGGVLMRTIGSLAAVGAAIGATVGAPAEEVCPATAEHADRAIDATSTPTPIHADARAFISSAG